MARSPFHRNRKNCEPGIILMEAVFASALFYTVVWAISPLFNRQIELANNARDLDLIEAAVNEDINAMRQFARFWTLTSSPYSPASFPKFGLGHSSAMVYNPDELCRYWNTARGDFDLSFSTDLSSAAGKIPSGLDLAAGKAGNKFINIVPGYSIARSMVAPMDLTELQPSVVYNNNQTTLRLRYSVRKLVIINGKSTPVSMPFSYERTADIQIPAAFSC